MDRILETGKRLAASRFFIPVFLFVISILAYGILIPWLGFYSDDWLFIFISQRFGANGLTSYFSTARPFFQPIFLAVTTLLGSTPWHYHLYALLMHWLCSVSFWWLLSLVWPAEKQRLAFWAALFFLVYPGFQPQPIALTFGNIFLVQAIFLISLASSVAAIRYKKYFWWFTLLGVLGSCVNLFVIEYFYLLELLRPFFIYAAISQPGLAVRERIKQTIKLSGIYAVVLLASAYWRLFLYKYQANVHPYTFPAMFKADPMLAVRTLLGQVIQDLWQAIFAAWKLAFQLPGKILSNTNSLVIYIAAIALTGVLMMAVLQLLNRKGQSEKRFPPTMAWIIAIAGLPLAGIPFWLTGLQIQFDWINSRYTLSYLISLSLLYAAVVLALSPKRWVSNILMTVLIAVSVGGQVINANDYRIDWGQQKDLYWQFSWRMPAIAPGTTVFINEQQGIAGSGTYLMAAVNWIYSNRTDGQLDYRIAYSRESLATLEENSFYIFENNYTGNFNGNPNKVLAANYSGRCLTVLDPDVDPFNPAIDNYSRQVAVKSHPELILPEAKIPLNMGKNIFGAEPLEDICYWYEKADLARWQGNWPEVVNIGDQHMQFNLIAYRSLSLFFPFIEGYAHAGQWEKAIQLTWQVKALVDEQTIKDLDAAQMLCNLWKRIESNTDKNSQQQAALKQVNSQLMCH